MNTNKLVKQANTSADIQKMIDAAEAGTVIKLSKKTYHLGQMLVIHNQKDLTIDGKGASLILNSLEADVISIDQSENIVLKNFMAKHVEPSGPVGCTGNVIHLNNSKNIVIENCELNGSGIVGIASYHNENLVIKKNYIHNNSQYPIISQNASVIIEANTFENNGSNIIYYEYVPKGKYASWPPTDEIAEDKHLDGLVMKNNSFKN